MPDPEPPRPALDPRALATMLAGSRWRVEVAAQSASTNADLAHRLRAQPSCPVLVTEHQTSGRGRLGRSWLTPPHAALTFSLPAPLGAVPVGRWGWLPLITGLAVLTSLRRATRIRARLKWPNDVLVGEQKVAGILVEVVDGPAGPVAVVGIGLNVTARREELPVGTATSLWLAGAGNLDRAGLLVAMLEAFAEEYDAWVGAEGRGPRASYRLACATLARHVRVDLPTGDVLRGRAVDVDEDGRLVVYDGVRHHALGAGDLVHVRPDGPPVMS